jgi:hypothetical protein
MGALVLLDGPFLFDIPQAAQQLQSIEGLFIAYHGIRSPTTTRHSPHTVASVTGSDMSIHEVTGNFRKKLKYPQLSCGREIDISSRGLNRKRAWWPRECPGSAMERFDDEIVPKIEDLLRNLDLGEEDIYIRLYMIGSAPTKSRPVIMVCCTNSGARDNVEGMIRKSNILGDYPEYRLGASALPLEQSGHICALAGTETDEKSKSIDNGFDTVLQPNTTVD